MEQGRFIGIILISAGITFFLRALPFLMFKGKKQLPEKVTRLGKILPSAIMAVLIVYCLKDVRTDFAGSGRFQLIAVAVVALSYKWKHNTFISIIAGTACYMILLAM